MPSGTGSPTDPRIYSIAVDTLNGAADLTTLLIEIQADAGITTALDSNHIEATGDVLSVFFVTALSAGELTALDAVVAAHTGVAASVDFQFWESNPSQSTSLETPQPGLSRTAPAMTGGIYEVKYNCELRIVPTGPVNSKARAQFSTDANIKGSHAVVETEWSTFSGWDRQVLSTGDAPVFLIEFWRDPTVGGNDSIEIRKMRIGLELVD